MYTCNLLPTPLGWDSIYSNSRGCPNTKNEWASLIPGPTQFACSAVWQQRAGQGLGRRLWVTSKATLIVELKNVFLRKSVEGPSMTIIIFVLQKLMLNSMDVLWSGSLQVECGTWFQIDKKGMCTLELPLYTPSSKKKLMFCIQTCKAYVGNTYEDSNYAVMIAIMDWPKHVDLKS